MSNRSSWSGLPEDVASSRQHIDWRRGSPGSADRRLEERAETPLGLEPGAEAGIDEALAELADDAAGEVHPAECGEGQRHVAGDRAQRLAEDLYGAELRVHLVKRLRAEQRFDGLDALKAQIAQDSQDARAAVADCSIDEATGTFG